MPYIAIGTSHLTFPLFTIPGTTTGFIDGSKVPTPRISLPARAGYRLQQGGATVADFEFEVKEDGTIDFDEAFDGFVTGRGEPRLTVRGLPVRLDVTALDHALQPQVEGASPLPADRTHDLSLLPCPNYGFQPGTGVVVADLQYGVSRDGKVILDAQFSGFAQAEGNTLTIQGHKVNIDGRALSHDLLPIGIFPSGEWLSHTTVNQLTLIPAVGGYGFQPGAGVVADLQYGVSRDGKVILDAQFSGFAQAEANTLTIRGHKVNIDGRALSHDLLPIGIFRPYEWLSHTTVNQLTLIPAVGGYGFQPGAGVVADLQYGVSRDGKVILDAQFSDFAQAEANTLTIRGHKVNIDGRALSHDLLPIGIFRPYEWLSHTTVNQLTLIPAVGGYGFQPGAGVVADLQYGVSRDGKVILDAQFSRFAQAEGNTLTIQGHKVNIDGRALSHDLLPIGIFTVHGVISHTTVNQLTLIPAVGGYGFQPGAGVVADLQYGVSRDGKVILDAQFSDFAQAEANTLTIRGHKVNIDGRALSHDLLPIGIFRPYEWLSHTTVNQLTLIPAVGGYGFQPGAGVVADLQYGVSRDGKVILDKVILDAQFSGFVQTEGNTLTIRGYPIVLDAADADSDLVGIVQLILRPQTPRQLIADLVPAKGYLPQTVNGVFSTAFNIERDGRITFDPGAAGRYIVKTSSSPNPSAVGQEVTISVYVRPAEPVGNSPQGIVSLRVGADHFGSTTLDASGKATLRTAGLPQGEHDISVDYAGSPLFEPSSVTVHHRVV